MGSQAAASLIMRSHVRLYFWLCRRSDFNHVSTTWYRNAAIAQELVGTAWYALNPHTTASSVAPCSGIVSGIRFHICSLISASLALIAACSRLAPEHKFALSRLATAECESQKRDGFRFALSTPFPVYPHAIEQDIHAKALIFNITQALCWEATQQADPIKREKYTANSVYALKHASSLVICWLQAVPGKLDHLIAPWSRCFAARWRTFAPVAASRQDMLSVAHSGQERPTDEAG